MTSVSGNQPAASGSTQGWLQGAVKLRNRENLAQRGWLTSLGGAPLSEKLILHSKLEHLLFDCAFEARVKQMYDL